MTERAILLLARLLTLSVISLGLFTVNDVSGNDGLQPGQKFEIIGELFAYGVREDMDSKEVSFISLVPLQLSGSEIISRQLVAKGSVMTVIGKSPRNLFAFLYPDRYEVRVDSITARKGIPVVISLYRGIEGKSTALNPEIFKTLP